MTAPSNNRWFRKWLRLRPHQIIGSDLNDPYLLRWYVIPRNRWLNVYVHKFLRDDDDRALHDHPWWFLSLVLWGQYIEVTDDGRSVRSAPEPWRLFWGDRPLVFRPALWRHRVELVKAPVIPVERTRVRPRPRALPCWTLIVTGPRTRLWGFWCPQAGYTITTDPPIQIPDERFVPWDEFGDAGCGES